MNIDEVELKAKKLEYFISESIDYTSGVMHSYKRKALAFRVASLMFGGAATVLLGLSAGDATKQLFVNIAFVLTALVTILNSLESFLSNRSLWVAHENAVASFSNLYDSLRFYLEGKRPDSIELARLEHYFSDYENIWNTLNETWQKERRSYRVRPLEQKKSVES
ncbi:SLATT domain-containing protein [Teredinibacter turnerae]|uniref:SLATT domain-containing protein n=1 Tax=Teredinibacter turnerae TaxID=2426 RepID=UPI00036FB262|nr:SLATT domain-containing protein [Teredinibacter turnerae]